MQTCPECGADREGAVRFCPNCGLDYWRAAAGEPAHAASPPPAQPPQPAGGGLNPSIFIWLGVVVLLVAGGALVIVSGILPAGLPGSRTAVVTPRQLTAEESLIHAFFREVRDPRASYALSFEGTTTFSGIEGAPAPITSTGEARLYGDNWRGHEEGIQDGETIFDHQLAVVDDVAYLSEDGGPWESGEIPERLQPISPFRRISTVTEVEYVSKDGGSGSPLHRLAITKWLGGRDYVLRPYARMVSQESRMEVLVDARGVPSEADIVLTIVATDGVETLTIEATFTYTITRWDDVPPVEAPDPGDPGTPSAARPGRS